MLGNSDDIENIQKLSIYSDTKEESIESVYTNSESASCMWVDTVPGGNTVYSYTDHPQYAE